MRTTSFRMALALALLAGSALVTAQAPDVYSDMHWRAIGPTRAGRARALAGVPSQPNVFYIGFDNGGVWRSTDYGSVWTPLFDNQPDGLDRRDCGRSLGPERHLRGKRRGHHPPRPVHGRRDVQVDRRGRDVDPPRAAGQPDDRRHRGGPEEPGPPVRRGARPSVRSERGARDLPIDRRRQDVRQGALPRRVHLGQRRADRSVEPAASSTPRCGSSSRRFARAPSSAAPATASSSRPTAARPGSRSRRDCPA